MQYNNYYSQKAQTIEQEYLAQQNEIVELQTQLEEKNRVLIFNIVI